MLNIVDLVLFVIMLSALIAGAVIMNSPEGEKHEDGVESVDERRRKIEADYSLTVGGSHFFY